MWWGIGISVAIAIPEKWYLIAGAVINNLMFLVVSVPLADGRQSKKEGFKEYKSQTHAFLPIPTFKK